MSGFNLCKTSVMPTRGSECVFLLQLWTLVTFTRSTELIMTMLKLVGYMNISLLKKTGENLLKFIGSDILALQKKTGEKLNVSVHIKKSMVAICVYSFIWGWVRLRSLMRLIFG